MVGQLTKLSSAGGCGCKIASNVLATVLQGQYAQTEAGGVNGLLVGNAQADDAAVYALDEERYLLATVDFFPPMLDDPTLFGKIAATNALSDIYAMGGSPLFALNITGFPKFEDDESLDVLRAILEGGRMVCEQAGISIAGGHSIHSQEPVYGLAVTGMVHRDALKTNQGMQAGDQIILGKPLGIGILIAGLQRGGISSEAYAELIRWTTKLNRVGCEIASLAGVHAMTDVTGFGLAGHLAELCKASARHVRIQMEAVPYLDTAQFLLEQGITTGAIKRNEIANRKNLHYAGRIATWQKNLLHDAQTSGGLLVSCEEAQLEAVLDIFHQHGMDCARRIGYCDGALSDKPASMVCIESGEA